MRVQAVCCFRRRRAVPHRRGAVLAVALLLTACASPLSAPANLPPPPAVVVVRMSEYRFQFPVPVPAGRVVFEVTNVGRLPHRLALIPLAEDIPPIREQLSGQQRRPVSTIAGVPDRRSGGRGTFAVDLVPAQRYAMICFNTDPDGKTHAVKGMAAEFRTPGARTAPPGPSASPSTSPPTTGVASSPAAGNTEPSDPRR